LHLLTSHFVFVLRRILPLLRSEKRLRLLPDKRPPSSLAHEREAEPFFWSRAVKPERDYKKTHAVVMSNGNRTGDTPT
jgi:hypothetical protein